MVEAVIFDLDGTLVQTEILKAISYARAAVKLQPSGFSESEVLDGFKEVVGRPRQEVAEYLLTRFRLTEEARKCMADFAVRTPWQAFAQIRLQIYEQMLQTPDILRQHLCPYNVGLLNHVNTRGLKSGLATMSHCEQANRVLEMIQLQDEFDFIATRDDVENGKPDPEIYLLVARELGVPPQQCLVIEDSLFGVKAALQAGMRCICVTTDFTRQIVHKSGLLEGRWIVDEPKQLLAVAQIILDGGI